LRSALRHRPGVWWWPIRLTFGAFFLHVALTHRELDERGAKGLQRFASTAYPILKKLRPRTFQHGMVAAESAVAASLLVPGVPAVVGGAALTSFGTALLGVYARTPMLRRDERSLRPNDMGLSIAKDSWMVAAGVAVIADAVLSRRPGGPSSATSSAAGRTLPRTQEETR
jgi:hypothetical protein